MNNLFKTMGLGIVTAAALTACDPYMDAVAPKVANATDLVKNSLQLTLEWGEGMTTQPTSTMFVFMHRNVRQSNYARWYDELRGKLPYNESLHPGPYMVCAIPTTGIDSTLLEATAKAFVADDNMGMESVSVTFKTKDGKLPADLLPLTYGMANNVSINDNFAGSAKIKMVEPLKRVTFSVTLKRATADIRLDSIKAEVNGVPATVYPTTKQVDATKTYAMPFEFALTDEEKAVDNTNKQKVQTTVCLPGIVTPQSETDTNHGALTLDIYTHKDGETTATKATHTVSLYQALNYRPLLKVNENNGKLYRTTNNAIGVTEVIVLE